VGGTAATAFDVSQIRALGIAEAGRTVVRMLEGQNISGYWVHLDADVLDPALLPAVDTPEPGGLTFEELAALLRALLASPLAIGLEITVFDPDLDPDGALARRLTDTIVAGLA